MHPRIPGGKVAIYARFSSDNQREASIEDQVRRCREYIAANGGDPAKALTFEDRAVSGASLERPGFEAMMGAVEHKEIDVIVTEDLSRISRDFADAALVFRRLRFADVPLIGVADGIDTSAKDAKLSFTLKSLVVDLYLDDLRDKTKRGQLGRALAGFSTGPKPYGYESEPAYDGAGRPIGFRLYINEERAEVVRRVFREFANGRSCLQIAQALNDEGIAPSPKCTRRKRSGWYATAFYAMLSNERYAGVWQFRKNETIKLPGSNRRITRPQSKDNTVTMDREDLRIVPPDLWDAVQARRAALRRKYAKGAHTPADKRIIAGNKSVYPFSGLLVCGVCDGLMAISGSGNTRYYRCSTRHKSAACPNQRTIRRDRLEPTLIDAIRERLMSGDGIAYVRERVAAELEKFGQRFDRDLAEHRARLAATESQIARLIQFIATGQQSSYIATSLRDLEESARADKSAIARLTHAATQPLDLPSIDDVTEMVFDLEARLAQDPDAGREALRQWFEGKAIVLTPLADGRYQVKGGLLPLMVLGSARRTRGSGPGGSTSGYGGPGNTGSGPTGTSGAGKVPGKALALSNLHTARTV